MTDTTPAAAPDERIAFRGPFQRILISPEIGALIGAALVWLLFWAVSAPFSTASQTASWLDAAAPIGMMAVAVSLLMIGGEFDLSAGVMTGSTGIMIGLMGLKFGGDGVSMWVAVLVAFVVSGAIGWLNGTFVNRTGLPSFIVTLATFFVLRGANLVFAKRLIGKVIVEGIDDVKGFDGFKAKLAEDFGIRQPFSGQGTVFLVLLIAAAVLGSIGLMLLAYVRRATPNRTLLGAGVLGLVVAIVGVVLLHNTDGFGGNLLGGAVGLGGAVAGLTLIAHGLFERRPAGNAAMPRAALVRLVVGLALVAAAILITRSLDADRTDQLLSQPAHWVKVLLAFLGAAAGAAFVIRRALPQWRHLPEGTTHSKLARSTAIQVVLAGGFSAAMLIAFLQLTTIQGFRAIIFVGLGVIGVQNLLNAKRAAGRVSPRSQLLLAGIAAAAVLALGFVIRHDSGTERFRSVLLGALACAAAVIVLNGVLDATVAKRRSFLHSQDAAGRWLCTAGLALAGLAVAIRMFYSGVGISRPIAWWLILTAVAAFVLSRTKYGNWIFAVGGNKDAARAIGVPVDKVKVGLFMTVSLVGCFVGMILVLRLKSVTAGQGVGQEFFFIIAAVVGGSLLTGGYGSVIGAAFGAMIYQMLNTGIPGARWNSDNQFIVLGVVLFLAVLVNQRVRKIAQESR